MRTAMCLLTFALTTCAGGAALGQSFDAAAAVEGFLTDADIFGADSATVGSVEVAADTVTARDVTMRWSARFGNESPVQLTGTVTIPEASIVGLAPAQDGHRAEQIVVPRAQVDFAAEGLGGSGPVAYDLEIVDYRLVDAEWGAFPTILADPQRPVSRFGPLIDWGTRLSYRSNAIERVSGTTTIDGDTSDLTYGPIAFGPVVDGRAESFAYGPFTQTQRTTVPSDDGQRPVDVTVAYGPISGTGVDINPIAALLTGRDGSDGAQPILRSMTLQSIVATAQDAFRLETGPVRIEDFTVDASEGPLLAKIDEVVLALENADQVGPDPFMPVNLLMDVYGAFGFGLYSFEDVTVQADGLDLSLGRAAVEDVSRDGLGRFVVTGLDVRTPDMSGSLGEYAVSDYRFPTREAVRALMVASAMGMAPDARTVMDVMPTLGNMRVEGLAFDTPEGPLRVGRFETSLSNYIPPVPTDIEIQLSGLSLPLGLVDNEVAARALAAMGADPVTADGTIELRWNEDAQRVEMTTDLAADEVGRLVANATLSGIPRFVFEDPLRAQEAIATAALNSLSATFDNAGLADFLIETLSAQSGVPAEAFATGMAEQARMQVGLITGNAEFAGEVAAAVEAFMTDPRSFTVVADPNAPVSFAQLLGAAMTAPNQVPGLLNLSIGANRE